MHAEPRAVPPRRFMKKRPLCPLSHLNDGARNSKDHIDAMEKLFRCGMPSRIIIEDLFNSLRNAVADDIESAMDKQWKCGLEHGKMTTHEYIMKENMRLREENDRMKEEQHPMYWKEGLPIPDSPEFESAFLSRPDTPFRDLEAAIESLPDEHMDLDEIAKALDKMLA